MNWEKLVADLFPAGHTVIRAGELLRGEGKVNGSSVAVVGTTNHAYIGIELALALAGEILNVIRSFPKRPILFLVDTRGQRLSRRDELLGINAYLAHLASCIALARARHHHVIGLAYDEAVSGGFLAGGMMADLTVALPEAHVQVMDTTAMARVMRIPPERMHELEQNSPVFSTAARSLHKLGGIAEIWNGNLAEHLHKVLASPAEAVDTRAEKGYARGGRLYAAPVISRVCKHA
jgi:malonate decarboxylase gamma subunit